MQTKKCSKCKEVKALDEFNKNRSMKDGLHYYCRTCHCEGRRKYHEENREAERERRRKYREENIAAESERARKYREENREAKSEYGRKFRAEVRDMTRTMATKSGRFSLGEDLVVLDETLTAYQKAVKLGRTYSSVKSRLENLRKKASQNA